MGAREDLFVVKCCHDMEGGGKRLSVHMDCRKVKGREKHLGGSVIWKVEENG